MPRKTIFQIITTTIALVIVLVVAALILKGVTRHIYTEAEARQYLETHHIGIFLITYIDPYTVEQLKELSPNKWLVKLKGRFTPTSSNGYIPIYPYLFTVINFDTENDNSYGSRSFCTSNTSLDLDSMKFDGKSGWQSC